MEAAAAERVHWQQLKESTAAAESVQQKQLKEFN